MKRQVVAALLGVFLAVGVVSVQPKQAEANGGAALVKIIRDGLTYEGIREGAIHAYEYASDAYDEASRLVSRMSDLADMFSAPSTMYPTDYVTNSWANE